MINTKRVTLTFSKRCNMRCPFCYGYFNGKDLLDIKKYKEIISKCQMFHIETLNIAGGDPLMYRRIGEIVKYSKSLGLRTTMDTNCLLFDPIEHEDIIKSLDMISVPIDGCNAETHDRIRVYKGSFDKIIYSLNEITDISKEIEIRVNTVIVKDACFQMMIFVLMNLAFIVAGIGGLMPVVRIYIIKSIEMKERFPNGIR